MYPSSVLCSTHEKKVVRRDNFVRNYIWTVLQSDPSLFFFKLYLLLNHRGGNLLDISFYHPSKDAKTHRTYSCLHCRAQLANHDELISKSFQGSQGRAYLFNSVVNVNTSAAEERVLLTGLHEVADIYCECCKTLLGWKYEHAFESSQKYKEGKYIIELVHMIKDNGWDAENMNQSKYFRK
ncbi:unnamed protein product [Adineta steineri]|uniref:Yippee domain-containing protein n=1 Tax=Adineta steineri TaxID=433720 RepID=A0A814I428_9BILA|nr:unnamed protein product [Adineta steineri]CAF0978659.1 unnamed protein product [Adineta steineri]CAF1020193.1 unnamed protein product [Adineta steineri]CAF1083851.1 unnamed protein product [Adineta steineri]CAF1216057.1 unnamed protein product [Adineta steineri]